MPPVIYNAAGLARNVIADEVSSSWPWRFNGVVIFLVASATLLVNLLVMK